MTTGASSAPSAVGLEASAPARSRCVITPTPIMATPSPLSAPRGRGLSPHGRPSSARCVARAPVRERARPRRRPCHWIASVCVPTRWHDSCVWECREELMHALVVYESIFGNTKQIADAIGEGLRAQADDVDVIEVGSALAQPVGIDLLVVGGPTHACGMTREVTRRDARQQAKARGIEPVSAGVGVREWMAALPERSAGSIATFDTIVRTRWFPTGSAAKSATSTLRRHGYVQVAEPEHFYVTDVAGPLEEGECERARRWG